jgi:hypothetical protein
MTSDCPPWDVAMNPCLSHLLLTTTSRQLPRLDLASHTIISFGVQNVLEVYERILRRPNQQDEWAVCVAYDAEVRRRSCTSSLDPAIFHLVIWNDLEAKHIARVALETVRAEIAKSGGSSQSSRSRGPSGKSLPRRLGCKIWQ